MSVPAEGVGLAVRATLQAARLAKGIKEQRKKLTIQNFKLVSGAIDEIWYDSWDEVLWVKFRKVKAYPKYRFDGVPQAVAVGLINAGSAGQYYHSNIKGNYYTTSIEGPGEADKAIRELMFNLADKPGG